MGRLVAVIAAASCLFFAARAGGAGAGAALCPGDGWRTGLSDGRLSFRVLGTPESGDAVVAIEATLCEYDLALTARPDGAGSFEVETDNAAPGSTDLTEGSITISGR